MGSLHLEEQLPMEVNLPDDDDDDDDEQRSGCFDWAASYWFRLTG
jgi:hypothetical protein